MTWVLLGAAILVVLATAGVIILMRMQRQKKALQSRISGFSGKRQQPGSAIPSSLVRSGSGEKPSLIVRAASVIRFDPARRDQYKLPWFAVVGGMLLAGQAAVLLASGLVGPWAWLLLPVITVGGSRAYHAGADRKRRGLLLAQFPDALALVVRAVRVGIPVPQALRAVAREMPEPTHTEFDRLQHQIAIGLPLEAALRELALRNELPEYGFFAAALVLQAQTGGGLTDTLETLGDIIRRRIAMTERGHALSSEARTTSYILGSLPIVAGMFLHFMAPAYLDALFSDSTGNMMLGAAALSLATGMGTMRMIIRRTLS